MSAAFYQQCEDANYLVMHFIRRSPKCNHNLLDTIEFHSRRFSFVIPYIVNAIRDLPWSPRELERKRLMLNHIEGFQDIASGLFSIYVGLLENLGGGIPF